MKTDDDYRDKIVNEKSIDSGNMTFDSDSACEREVHKNEECSRENRMVPIKSSFETKSTCKSKGEYGQLTENKTGSTRVGDINNGKADGY